MASMQTINEAPDQIDKEIVETIEKTGEQLGQVRDAISQVIFGQQNVVDLSTTTILTGGHALLVGLRPEVDAEEMRWALYKDVKAHAGTAPASDDLTVMGFRWFGPVSDG